MAEGGFAFAFREGALVKALRQGHWVLLDEINLAPSEVACQIAACSKRPPQHQSVMTTFSDSLSAGIAHGGSALF